MSLGVFMSENGADKQRHPGKKTERMECISRTKNLKGMTREEKETGGA